MNGFCAYFERENESLEDAQLGRVHHILKKLCLQPHMTLLDIQCEWGCLLIEAAKLYRIHGVGITMDQNQFFYMKDLVEKEGVPHLVEIKLMDYAMLKKSGMTFDRIVCVTSFEHVTNQLEENVLDTMSAVLKDQGMLLMDTIICNISQYNCFTLWAKENFHLIDIENLRQHYEKMRNMWYDTFVEKSAAFHNKVYDYYEIVMTKGVNNLLPYTRDYIYQDNNLEACAMRREEDENEEDYRNWYHAMRAFFMSSGV